jgi:drug/metabolite transporter (DMT)-like permease
MARSLATQDALRGIGWMTLAAAGYAVTAVSVRMLGGDFSAMEIVFWRTVIALAMLGPWLAARSRLRWLGMRKMPGYLVRSLFTLLAMGSTYYALARMPIADVYALQFTLPLFAIVLSIIALGERASATTWLACAAGFAGTVVVLRPGLATIDVASAAALASAVFYAVTNVMVKVLVRRDGADLVTTYGNLFLLPLSAVPTLYAWTTPEWRHLPWILALGTVTTLAQFALAKAVAAADARIVWPFDFLRLPFTVVAGYLLFGELPSLWTWIGAAIIFAAAYAVIRRETRS